MFASFKMEAFNPQYSKWHRYCEQLKHYLIANQVEERLKLSTVLSLIGNQAFNLLCDLLAPESPSSKTVEEIFDILEQHYSPKPIARSERFKFRNRKQGQDEPIADFVAALRKLSLDCAFSDKLEFHLSDQFVFGLANAAVQRRLLAEDDNTPLSKLIQLASIAELTAKDSVTLNKSPDHFREIGKVQCASKGDFQASTQPCKHCGSCSHLAKDCKYLNASCNLCHKKGHISPICRQKKFLTDKSTKSSISNRPRKMHAVSYSPKSGETIVLSHVSVKHLKSTEINPLIITLKVNNILIDFELDSGAAVSLIPKNIFDKYFSRFKYMKTDIILNAFGNTFKPIGKLLVDVSFKDKHANKLELFIVDKSTIPLLGRSWFTDLGILENFMSSIKSVCPFNVSDELNNLISKFKTLFSTELGAIKNFKAHLFVKEGATPRFFKYRPVPFALLPMIEAELSKLQDQGILSPIKFSDWAAPIVPLLKKDKTIRICGDYKVGLNPALLVDQYPLPVINEVISKLSGGVFFSKLDLAQAYQQVLMDEESTKFLTINTHKGLFRVNRLPFGISSAPAIFQELMDKILSGISNIVCYLDDILIASPDLTSHFQTLHTVLGRLEEAGIHLNQKKCEFVKEEIIYLDHVINKSGIHNSPDKIKSLLAAPEPKNADQLRSFVGLMSYYRKFLPNLASTLAPLNALLCKNTKWNWNEAAIQAFSKAKQSVASSSVLTHYNPDLPLVLATDASPTGLGAVISHTFPDGSEQPIAFASRTLCLAERNYSQIDKEALSIIFGIKKFHQYLFGRKFILLTDHKPLTYIFNINKNIPVLASARIQRWALMLAAYSYDIKFRPSKANANADALSRLPLSCGRHLSC